MEDGSNIFWKKHYYLPKLNKELSIQQHFALFLEKLFLVGGINYDKEGGGRIVLNDVLIIENTEETYSVSSVKIATIPKIYLFQVLPQ